MIIADDFGLGRMHDAVILSLIAEGRIDGTSVMIDGAMTAADIATLRALRDDGARIGLHLNLTHDFDVSFPSMPLGALMKASLSRRLPAVFGADFQRQTARFVEVFGGLPDYYDGHQHCHCLPGLSRIAAALPGAGVAWMRVPLPATPSGLWANMRAGGFKVAVIAALAWRARTHFRKAGFATNSDFSGFLRLDDPDAVAVWLPRLMAAAAGEGLIMTHPGAVDDPSQCEGHAARSRAVEARLLRRPTAPARKSESIFGKHDA
ncbi:ChbG/HpnK family deacetylase [Martelella alba]|uniref:ChbG/HpnK family deacetylase n=1 Tax=Martelella alba TaxID=2590451 RepID=A0A506UB51_9HYPH|nr:ChbG/HpnK family deacetylase [Martelella alba]TPW31593.1 ChbG/HpnK family deacetylase [Martelella alba]